MFAKNISLLSGALLLSGTCLGATFSDKPVKYASKNHMGEKVELTIPFISTENQQVADRINNFLHIQLLNTLPPGKEDAATKTALIELELPLESMEPASSGLVNGKRQYAIVVSTEGCGAYCSLGEIRFDFDTRTGRAITPLELLSESGKKALAALAQKTNARRLRTEIARLEKLRNKGTKERDKETIAEQIELYERCLEERYTKSGSLYDLYLKYPGQINILDGALSFDSGTCSAHVNRAIDDLGNLIVTLKAPQLNAYLSNYGKYILLGEGDGAIADINPYAQVFRGKINGNTPITLMLTSNAEGVYYPSSRYFYDKHRKAIELKVEHKQDLTELTEFDSKGKPSATISYRRDGNKLLGHWRGAGKTLTFEAAP
ncbi:hypothetical protein [Undibacterium sp.]|jgi:hypothetical protein|uniref:hypothetical protein n=1 Tax=Undibacterium sp. TaxID=1914977 RepID=UPI0027317A8B|nr:hypothetical protein [Undibacterium sp.]MDP1979024.1 hypothetical protein [Undibacterium sp.]